MKKVRIEGQFPDLKGNCYADGNGTGSTVKAAISRAVADLLKDRKLRKKRIHSIVMKIFIQDAVDTNVQTEATTT